MIDLSVLVCTTYTRYKTFGRSIQEQLWPQFEALSVQQRERVQVLILNDDKSMMLGEKRNAMVAVAKGRYVVFVDDDDRIASDYIATILEATSSDADVITFPVAVSLNGEPPKTCYYSKDFSQDRNLADRYERLPNHICCTRRELALAAQFPDIPYGEDSGYSKSLHPLLRTEHRIDRVLYFYDYSSATTEAQLHHRR